MTKHARQIHQIRQIWPNAPNIEFGIRIWTSQIWSSGVSLKRSCKMQLRFIDLMSKERKSVTECDRGRPLILTTTELALKKLSKENEHFAVRLTVSSYPPAYGHFVVNFFCLLYDSMWVDFTPEKSFSYKYKNSQLFLTVAAALSHFISLYAFFVSLTLKHLTLCYTAIQTFFDRAAASSIEE